MEASWRRNHGGEILEEEAWRRNLGGIWEASGKHLGGWVGHGGSRASWEQNVSKPLCFTANPSATDHFVSTRREQVSQSDVKTDTFAVTHSSGIGDIHIAGP